MLFLAVAVVHITNEIPFHFPRVLFAGFFEVFLGSGEEEFGIGANLLLAAEKVFKVICKVHVELWEEVVEATFDSRDNNRQFFPSFYDGMSEDIFIFYFS